MAENNFTAHREMIAAGLAELVESRVEDFGKIVGSLVIVQGLTTYVKEKGLNPDLTVGVFEGLIRAFIRTTKLDPAVKTGASDILDSFFDGVKDVNEKSDERQTRAAVTDAVRKGERKVTEVLKSFDKKATKPTYTSLLMQLTSEARDRFRAWEQWMSLNAKQSLAMWHNHKSKIATLSELEEVDRIRSANADGTMDWQQTTNDRLAALDSMYGHKQTLPETIVAALSGEDTPHTRKLEEKATAFITDAQAFTTQEKAKTAAIRARNPRYELPDWVLVTALLVFLVIGIFIVIL